MTGRGHEGIASDRGQGAIFSVERRPGAWLATVRSMGDRRPLIASQTHPTRAGARRALADLKRRLAANQGPVEAVLAGWSETMKGCRP